MCSSDLAKPRSCIEAKSILKPDALHQWLSAVVTSRARASGDAPSGGDVLISTIHILFALGKLYRGGSLESLLRCVVLVRLSRKEELVVQMPLLDSP